MFSHRPQVREEIINAVGRRPATDLPRVRYIEASTIDEVLSEVDRGGVDLAILDGEAQPTGGMGLSRQLKNEIDGCPPIVLAVRRKDDRWLATWSQADAVLVHPLDPLAAAETVAEVLRSHLAPEPDAPVPAVPAADGSAPDSAQDSSAQDSSAQAVAAPDASEPDASEPDAPVADAPVAGAAAQGQR